MKRGIRANAHALGACLALVLGIGACGGAQAESEKTEDTSTSATASSGETTGSTIRPADEKDHSDDLPVSTTYGYLEVTLAKASSVVGDPSQFELAEDAVGPDEAMAVFSVELSNTNEEQGWTIPYQYLMHLDVDGEEYDVANEGSFEVAPGDSATAQTVFVVPTDTDLSMAKIILQEFANDPDERRRPAFLGVDGSKDRGFKSVELKDIDGSPLDLGGCEASIRVQKIRIDDAMGFKDNDAPVWDGNGDVGLVRPHEGQLFATVLAEAVKNVEACALLDISSHAPVLLGANDVPRQFVSSEATTLNWWGPEPTPWIFVFSVDENQDAFRFELRDVSTPPPAFSASLIDG